MARFKKADTTNLFESIGALGDLLSKKDRSLVRKLREKFPEAQDEDGNWNLAIALNLAEAEGRVTSRMVSLHKRLTSVSKYLDKFKSSDDHVKARPSTANISREQAEMLLAASRASRTPPNVRRIEPFVKPYRPTYQPFGNLANIQYPIVTKEVGDAMASHDRHERAEEAKRRRRSALHTSGVIAADQIAQQKRVERLIGFRERLRAFHESFAHSGFGRYARTEERSNAEIDDRIAYEREANRRHRESASRASMSTRRMRLEGAEQFPMWRRFFKDSRNQASDIRHMYRTLHKMSKVPIVGRFIRMGPAGLAMSAGAIGTSFLSKYWSAEDTASKKVTKWENAELFYGKPSKAFENAAKSAGIADPGQRAAFWGKFSQMGIPPEVGMAMVGNSVRGGDPVIQRVIGEMFRLSPDEVVASRFFTGELSKSAARNLSENLDALGVEKAYGMAAGGDKLRGIELSMPFSKDIEARTGRSLFSFLFDAFAAAQGFGENPFEQAKESARSLNTASANSASQSNRGSSDTYIYVNGDVRTDAENVGDLAQDIENRADIGIRREVIEMFDSRKSR